MSTFILEQSTAGTVYVFLENLDGTPALNLTSGALTFFIKKANDSVFSSLVFTTFAEVGEGVYAVGLSAAHTDTLGSLLVLIKGVTIHTALVSATVTDEPVVPPEDVVLPANKVSVFGYVYDVSGNPVANTSVVARLLKSPASLSPFVDFISASSITTKTNDVGLFSLILVEGLEIDVSIPVCNFRRTIIVPAVNTNLFSIP